MNLIEARMLLHTQEVVQARLLQLNDPAHGWEHVQRVYTLTNYIASHEGADHFVTGMAALLHDIGREIPGEHAVGHHADRSEAFTTQLLDQYQLTDEQTKAILHAIVAHSFSRGVLPRTLEASVVRDADRLDALGAIGILRWGITGGVRNTPFTYHPDDPFAEQHELDDNRYMLDHFYCKLLRLEETMLTETGRSLARSRIAFMRTYLEALKTELCIQGT